MPALGTTQACADGSIVQPGSIAGGAGGAARPRRGARGAEPPRKHHTQAVKKEREGQRHLADPTPAGNRVNCEIDNYYELMFRLNQVKQLS